jgi:hypothetical protein
MLLPRHTQNTNKKPQAGLGAGLPNLHQQANSAQSAAARTFGLQRGMELRVGVEDIADTEALTEGIHGSSKGERAES